MTPKLGTCYYPEHWPEEMWDSDAARMKAAGLTWVRIGEFAWSRIEPSEGQFDWGWLDRAVEVLAAEGLQIVMGTPTATPPKWLVDKMPDMLAVDANGNPRGFGSRRHYCFSHQGYRREAARITRAVAERYAKHPAVQAWQTDNEYGCHDTTISYSVSALQGFRDWLAQKYQSPAALNRAWGNVFWSMEYGSFDEVELPNLTVTEPNPAHVMDFRRYSSDQVVAFNRIQSDILREYTNAPLIHNYMGRYTEFDHFDVGADLDVASWDSYPLGFLEVASDMGDAHKAAYLRQGDPDFQAFHHDLYRAVGRGRWWVMEQQPGPVNWAHYNPKPLPGMVRLWTWEAIAHGAEAVCYFRWRQAPFAQEQMHAGLLRVDSEDAPALAEARQVADELAELGDVALQQAEVALIWDYPSQWAWETQPQGADFDYFRTVFETYQSLRRLGVDVDILPSSATDFIGYKVIFAPALFSASEGLANALARSDAVVVFGPRYNSKTPDFAVRNPLPPAIAGLDVTVSRVESLRPGFEMTLSGGGSVRRWLEEVETGAEVLETTEDGAPVVLRNGRAVYITACLDDLARDRIVADVLASNDIVTDKLPEGLRSRRVKGRRLLFNYSAQTVLYGTREIAPAEVVFVDA